MGSSFCWSSQEDRLTSPRISWQMERDFRNRHVVPTGSGSPPAKGWGRSSNSRCPDKLQESLKSPANMALQSHKLWDTNNPIDRNPTKGDAPTNSCSEPQILRSQTCCHAATVQANMRARRLVLCCL